MRDEAAVMNTGGGTRPDTAPRAAPATGADADAAAAHTAAGPGVSHAAAPARPRPLTARSIVLSTLLGHHPPRLPARALVRVGALFGVAEGSVRVALTRMVAAGDLRHHGGAYQLTERLLARQAWQDDSRAPRTRRWDGGWEIAVVTSERRDPGERAALRQAMAALRLAELREGTWLRPANLVRTRPPVVAGQCALFTGAPEGDPAHLAARLWDLDGWARQAWSLRDALERAEGPADRFTAAAAVLRHLLADPVLPARLLPGDWPGVALRRAYDAFERDFRALLARLTAD
ncbi:PaaX family transcriptional regulator C-terminal domain-containing protein [Streptomyces sp. B1866]|uniref:PaaX family transcriptional regulator C-terminal domain-containing protein n=1 Tax=Streptomyces sp. B1866 TaxID=3075431 RepID=UPI00288E6A94|nr:PaaX family transcriptional regulator C-terminal domain-containing protein [Streptomyces sp. B1866]MDT3397888.1 PaaX family transcriptional regulator C-terminal domain-containing protein [Streptomyces sp. B1866]